MSLGSSGTENVLDMLSRVVQRTEFGDVQLVNLTVKERIQ